MRQVVYRLDSILIKLLLKHTLNLAIVQLVLTIQGIKPFNNIYQQQYSVS